MIYFIKYWRDGLLVLGAAMLLTAWHTHNVGLVQLGQARERARVADSTLAVLSKQAARIDTVYQKDTVRLRVAITQTVTLRDTLLQHKTDTLMVERYIARTDSTIHACTEVIQTCEQQQAVLRQEVNVWKVKATTTEPHSDLLPRVLWGVVGVGIGFLAHR